MSEETEEVNEWGANPERYEKLAEPVAHEEAEANTRAFMKAVGELRERFHIPELLVQFQVYVIKEGEEMSLTGGCGWGNQLKQAKLARKAADREFAHLAHVIEATALAMPELWRTLLTDPSNE